MSDTLHNLQVTIKRRKSADPDTSYVASLFAKGRGRMARKLGEEATEAIIAAMEDDPVSLTGEAADLIFHLLVLMEDVGVPLDAVLNELERREGQSGLAEKAARKG
jgi:phosphoribosyl-ATP pyrophosphohydrolase